jgi:hypothetical protein
VIRGCTKRHHVVDSEGSALSTWLALFLAVPDPSGKVSDLLFDSRLRLGSDACVCQLRPAIPLGSSFQHAVVQRQERAIAEAVRKMISWERVTIILSSRESVRLSFCHATIFLRRSTC